MFRESFNEIAPGAMSELQDPPGYPPLQIERGSDGKLYLGGSEFSSYADMPIGPEPHHLKVFIEYERTFGRGQAKLITHDPDLRGRSDMEAKYGSGFGSEYERLRSNYDRAALNATAEESNLYIEELRAYRSRFAKLYSDAELYEKKEPKASRIKISS